MNGEHMRLLFVVQDMEAYTGGPLVNSQRLLPELAKRGHQVYALVAYYGNRTSPLVNDLVQQGIECVSFRWPEFTEDLIAKILTIAKDINPDIFIANISLQGAYAGRWLKEAGIPTIVAHRSDDQHNWCMVNTFILGKRKWQASGLLCVSNYLKNEVEKKLKDPIPIQVIPSGAPPSKYTANHTPGTLKVVYAGRLVQKQKRIQDLVGAFIRFLQDGNDFMFTVIGEGPEKENLKKMVIDARLSDKIVFKAMKIGEAYHQELSKHHVIVLMSDYEGIPGSIIDGMMCGLVPVCRNFHGIDDLVIHERIGLIVTDDQTDLQQALARLMRDVPFRKKLSQHARQHAETKFSVTTMADNWDNLLAKVRSNTNTDRKPIQLPTRMVLPTATMPFEASKRRNYPLFHLLKKGCLSFKFRIIKAIRRLIPV